MNTLRIRSLAWLAGCLGCAALADQTTESPSQELMEAYQFKPQLLGNPAITLPLQAKSGPTPVITEADSSGLQPKKPDDYDLRGLAEAFANEKKRRAETFFTWNLTGKVQVNAIGRPNFQELEIPWTPMMPAIGASASSKLQVRLPILSAVW